MNQILHLINRDKELFTCDLSDHNKLLEEIINKSTFLVLGAAGSIGQAVTKEIFKRNPIKLHAVDISENNMVELVRDIRSTYGYIDGDFKTFALDIGSIEYDAFIKQDGRYDYVLNLSALKHVRSEKDPFTLMRMIDVNILNTDKTLKHSIQNETKKYFCVSTDKAANPVNMMGASKRIMEMFVNRNASKIKTSMARFANVAFSDGSLLHGFDQRIKKNQPIVAPYDIKRYFITPQESGELCLMSCIFGENGDIFFPKLSEALHLVSFATIATKYLKDLGYTPHLCQTEEEAREFALILPQEKKWPCLFTLSDTTGEKDFEEFYTNSETLDMNSFTNFGVIKTNIEYNHSLLTNFENKIRSLKANLLWNKQDILNEFLKLLPDFDHKETGKYLDSKM